MKHCFKCQQTKDESEFNKCRSRPDGLQTQCRECKRAYLNKYYYSEHGNEVSRRYYEANKEVRNKQSREYYKKHAASLNTLSRAYYVDNKDKWKISNKRWYEANKEYYRAKDALRGARKKAVNQFTDKDELWILKEAMALAKIRTKLFNVAWEVDHIIPISKGGAHSADNIQVVPASWNRKKSNKHTEKFFGAN